jgi:hypothetical protein
MNGCSRRADPQLYGEQNHGYLVMGEDGGLLNPHDMMEHYGPVSRLCKYIRAARLLLSQEHHLMPLSSLERYQHLHGTNSRAKRSCRVCHKKASYYCVTCSNLDRNFIATLCNVINRSNLNLPSCFSRYHLGEDSNPAVHQPPIMPPVIEPAVTEEVPTDVVVDSEYKVCGCKRRRNAC